MRFAVALVTLLLAGVLVAAGVAQRTVLKPPDHVTVAATIPSSVHYVVVPARTLVSHPGAQTLRLSGGGTTFAAYGKPADITAWLSGERYAELGSDASGAPTTRLLTAPEVAGLTGGGTPDPDGSDLWIAQKREQGSLRWTLGLPSDLAVLIASDGASAAPSRVSVTWPETTATPFAVPLIVAGGALAVLGLLLYVWALVHVRRRRGPRRKPPAKLSRRPAPPKYRPQRPAAVPVATERGRRSVRQRIAVGGALLLGGTLLVPAGGASAAPATRTAAVTETQAVRIVHEAAEVAAEADRTLDAKTLAQRFTGSALTLRTASYTIRKRDKKVTGPDPIPVDDTVLQLTVPERTDTWPRTLFAVVAPAPGAPKPKGKDKVLPVALAMVQNDPRADYLVQYAMQLKSGITLPTMPNVLTGSGRVKPDATVLSVQPQRLASQYGLLLRKQDAAPAKSFRLTGDPLLANVGEAAKARIVRKAGSTAAITFKDLPSDAGQVIGLTTAGSGALVSVPLSEQWTAKPRRSGVTITPSGATKALARTSATKKGIVSVYGYELLFFVPSAGSGKPVELLGYAQGLVSAKEL